MTGLDFFLFAAGILILILAAVTGGLGVVFIWAKIVAVQEGRREAKQAIKQIMSQFVRPAQGGSGTQPTPPIPPQPMKYTKGGRVKEVNDV